MPSSHENKNANEESVLIRAVLNDDMDAFKKLITQYEGLVISIVFKMVRQAEDREDLCQEVFLRVYEKLSYFRFQSKLSTWIGSIAFNTCINFLKKKKGFLLNDLYKSEDGNDNPEQIVEIPDSGKSPDELLMMKEAGLLLKENIKKLSVIQRAVLQLFHHDELLLEEIAVITGLPVNTVKSHLYRARAILKNEMVKQLNS